MARIRTIKPDIWIDEKFVALSLPARLLFIGTWNFADDDGNLERNAIKLKMQIFPGDSFDCEPLIIELISNGRLTEYHNGGSIYLHINNFAKHQVINRRSKPILPPYNSDNTHGGLYAEGKGKEGKGIEVPPNPQRGLSEYSGNSPKQKPTDLLDATFETWFTEFHATFPKSRFGAIDKAKSAYRKALGRASHQKIMEGVGAYAISDEALKDGGQFCKGAAPWLNDNRWERPYRPYEAPRKVYADVATEKANAAPRPGVRVV